MTWCVFPFWDCKPTNNLQFTSRTVTGTRPTATKNLAQRNSRVPPPTKFPSPDWQETAPTRRRDGHSHITTKPAFDNNARHGLDDPEEPRHTFRGRSPSPERHDARAPVRVITLFIERRSDMYQNRYAISMAGLSPTV